MTSATISELERDLELERKKVRELQDAHREQNKEYQKLKVRLLYQTSPSRSSLAPGC